MEQEVQPVPPSQFIMASLYNNNNNNSSSSSSSSPTIRFLGFFTQPQEDNFDSNPFELEESDVIWSSPDDSPPPPSSSNIDSPTDSISNSPTNTTTTTQSHSYSFRSEKFGLSAALSSSSHHDHHDRSTLVHRKTSLSPSAARMIPPISNPPRSFSSSDDFSGKLLFHQSAPVNVPIWPKKINTTADASNHHNNNNGSARLGFFKEEQDEETEEEMLPPHEIVARSHSTTTFSVFEGVGRTLKGRDLRSVRNAVFQKTGFLD